MDEPERVTTLGPANTAEPPCAVMSAFDRTKTRAPGKASSPLNENRFFDGSRKLAVSGVPMPTRKPPTSTREVLPKMMLLLPTNQTLPPKALPTLPSMTPSILVGLRVVIRLRTIQLRAPKLKVTVSSGLTSKVAQLSTVRWAFRVTLVLRPLEEMTGAPPPELTSGMPPTGAAEAPEDASACRPQRAPHRAVRASSRPRRPPDDAWMRISGDITAPSFASKQAGRELDQHTVASTRPAGTRAVQRVGIGDFQIGAVIDAEDHAAADRRQ